MTVRRPMKMKRTGVTKHIWLVGDDTALRDTLFELIRYFGTALDALDWHEAGTRVGHEPCPQVHKPPSPVGRGC